MKKIFSLFILLLATISGFSQDFYHWKGSVDGLSLDLALAERSDGLLAGHLVTVENGLTLEHSVLGAKEDGTYYIDSYYLTCRSYTLNGKIDVSGDYECQVIPDDRNGVAKSVVLEKDAPLKDFENPFIHASYEDLDYISIFVFSLPAKSVDGDDDFRTVTTMSDGKGGLIFCMNATGAGYMLGDLFVGEDPQEDAEYLPFKDGIVDYTVNKLSIRLEFFKGFLRVTRTCEFNPSDPMHVETDMMMGSYLYDQHFPELPVWWYESEGDPDEYDPDCTEIGELIEEIRYIPDSEERAIDVDFTGNRPNIEDYFKAFHKKYQGAIVDRTSELIYGPADASGKSSATLDKKNGFLKSDLEGHYYEGMQMCYWKTPTDHDIIAVRLNYTGLSQYDTYNSTLLLFYEYDTEKHKMRPMSAAGFERWAISDAYLLPENVTAYSNIQLPQHGKDIVYYEDYGPEAKKHILHWNGEWFEY